MGLRDRRRGYHHAVTVDMDGTVEGARAAERADKLDQWVKDFLGSDGSDNDVLGHELSSVKSHWYGPVELEFDRLHRLAGPPDHPTLERLTDDDLETVEGMVESLEDGWEPPPFIVSLSDDHLVLEDGNHRIEGLRRVGRHSYWSIVGFDDEDERRRFLDEMSAALADRRSN